jgi:hypothetical protein
MSIAPQIYRYSDILQLAWRKILFEYVSCCVLKPALKTHDNYSSDSGIKKAEPDISRIFLSLFLSMPMFFAKCFVYLLACADTTRAVRSRVMSKHGKLTYPRQKVGWLGTHATVMLKRLAEPC